MKQKWIEKRMKMLHKLLPSQKKNTAQLVESFMAKQIQTDFHNTVTYEGA
jgi:hypothetical protein